MDQNVRFLMSIVLNSLMSQGSKEQGARGAPSMSGGVEPATLLTAVLDMLTSGHLEELLSSQTHREVLGQVASLPLSLLVGGGWRTALKLLLSWTDKEDR